VHPLKIVIDENIPFGPAAFGKLGTVTALPGRAISPEMVRDATALVVRSVTCVNAALLQGSAVQFVGTATAGCDHIDRDYLSKNRILFVSAAGANANSVAEYVISALFMHAQEHSTPLQGKTLGIIGVGHVGQLLAQKAAAIGMNLILNDPPLQRSGGKHAYRSFEETCAADFVSLHVPLSYDGPDATRHLLNEKTLRAFRPETLVINTSRGEVADEAALFKAVKAGRLLPPVLDVWANEPDINWDFVRVLESGTPHIAGYALDGKIKSTQIIYEALCAALGVMPAWPHESLGLPKASPLHIDAGTKDALTVLSNLCRQAYDLSGDRARLTALLHLPPAARPAAFERLRKTYPVRREFRHLPLTVQGASLQLHRQITGLGFKPQAPKLL